MDGKLDRDERARAIGKLRSFFREERDEDLGELAAGLLLDFIETELGPAFHNQGVRAAKKLILRVSAALDDELDVLEKLPPR